ncbi:MAG TPA: lysylphosphatidylglycerol synthase domain-containing protein [Candidatus Angelobacter sp.]|nr:lysylphosphatidylglycerol synthase domain-containing protein [Candidatus Angelobacter sp.]
MKRGQLLVVLTGAALFAWVIVRVGPSAILQQLKVIRFALPVLIVLSTLRLLLQTGAWSAALRGAGISVAPRKLIGVRLASQSLGYLTVLGPLLSEPMKIKLLRSSTAPTITATMLDNGVYWFTAALTAIAGCICAAFLAIHGAHYSWTVVAVTLLAVALFLIARRRPILSGIVRVLGRRCPSWLARGEAIEREIRDYRLQQPGLVARMFWIDAACQLLLAFEVVVVLWSLRLPIHVVTVLGIEGLTRALKMLSGWLPARLGADEGGAVSAFLVAGFSPVFGLTLALTRRTRDLLWSLMGLAWLAWMARHAKDQENSTKHSRSPIAKEAFVCR